MQVASRLSCIRVKNSDHFVVFRASLVRYLHVDSYQIFRCRELDFVVKSHLIVGVDCSIFRQEVYV